jgi:hypothetical protein
VTPGPADVLNLEGRRLRLGLVVAVLLHVAFVAWVHSRRARVPSAAQADASSTEIAVEWQVAEPALTEPAQPEPGRSDLPSPGVAASRAATAPDVARAKAEPPTLGVDNGHADGVVQAPGAEDNGGWTFDATKGVGTAGLRQRFGVPPSAPAVADGADQGGSAGIAQVARDLDADDVARGFGRGGPLQAAVLQAARGPDAPATGDATFEVRVHPDGTVSASILDASSDRLAWSNLSKAIVAATRARAVRMPPNGKGLAVVIQVEAKERLPDGREPKTLGTEFAATAGGITEGDGGTTIGLPFVGLAHRGKVCSVMAGVGGPVLKIERNESGLPAIFAPIGISGGCSPENAGGVASRVVHAKIVREERF